MRITIPEFTKFTTLNDEKIPFIGELKSSKSFEIDLDEMHSIFNQKFQTKGILRVKRDFHDEKFRRFHENLANSICQLMSSNDLKSLISNPMVQMKFK